jgi:serine/threonine-protein kinase
MAPEQVDSERFGRVGPATDIHALGLLLDRLLTGIAPHADRSTTEIYRAILLEEPRPADDVVRGLPGDLVAVGLKARAKRPEQRYGSSAAFAADLGRFLAGTPTIARPRTAFERLWDGGRRRHPRLQRGGVAADRGGETRRRHALEPSLGRVA